jgi:GNAT superfamily N-acetyltransferase
MLYFDTNTPPLERLKIFERSYEDALQETDETLLTLGLSGHNMILWKDREMVAHTVGIAVSRMPGEPDEDCRPWADTRFNTEVLYMYATTVREDFQGKGFGKLLCAYYAGFKKAQGFKTLLGHATSPSMCSIRKWMNAQFRAKHSNWCGSERTAEFYVQQI